MASEEIDYEVKFSSMSFVELRKWESEHSLDWERGEIPEWVDSLYDASMKAGKLEFPKKNLIQLMEIYETFEGGGGELELLCLNFMKSKSPISDLIDSIFELQEQIEVLKVSIGVLLKETEAEQIPLEKRANITPAQLSELKGGLET